MLKKMMIVVVVIACMQPPTAEAAYLGAVSRQTGYTFEVAAVSTVTTSVTFLSVVRGRLEVDSTITVAGNFPTSRIAISRSAERVILLADTQGGIALVRINGVAGEVGVNPEARIVFDVTD